MPSVTLGVATYTEFGMTSDFFVLCLLGLWFCACVVVKLQGSRIVLTTNIVIALQIWTLYVTQWPSHTLVYTSRKKTVCGNWTGLLYAHRPDTYGWDQNLIRVAIDPCLGNISWTWAGLNWKQLQLIVGLRDLCIRCWLILGAHIVHFPGGVCASEWPPSLVVQLWANGLRCLSHGPRPLVHNIWHSS